MALHRSIGHEHKEILVGDGVPQLAAFVVDRRPRNVAEFSQNQTEKSGASFTPMRRHHPIDDDPDSFDCQASNPAHGFDASRRRFYDAQQDI